jgi:kynureninase
MSAPSRDDCVARDRDDRLASYRDEFVLPEGIIYLDGNSLGALPKAAEARVHDAIKNDWGKGLIRSWNAASWIDLPVKLGAKIAPLIGAATNEVIVADSTSVNLFKLLVAALRLRPDRRTILMEARDFPTDLYIGQGVAELMGDRYTCRIVPTEEIAGALDDTVAVLALTHVNFKTGAVHDMTRLTKQAHAVGALTIWDLSHTAGAMPVDLTGAKADFALGCTYKYLNGGPGAPAFAYIPIAQQPDFHQPLTGWMGHAKPFAFVDDYAPAPDIKRFLSGTPSVLSMISLDAALDVWAGVDLNVLRNKSIVLGDLFIALVEARCAEHGFALASPRDGKARGSQVSFRHDQGYAIMQALIARGVIGDFRAPDIVRFGFTPLYTRYVDVWQAAEILYDIMETRAWDTPAFRTRGAVT